MKSITGKPFGLLLLFGSLLGVELFVFYLLLDSGLIAKLLAEDYSYISRAILIIYLAASAHAIYAAYRVSLEILGLGDESGLTVNTQVRKFLGLLRQPRDPAEESGAILIEALDGRCRSRFRFGYVIADLMLKLGLLGTVIGFIFMLGSLVDLDSIDITVMQQLLGEMSGGMKVALFTTLTGMSCGILLNMKYQLLDSSVDGLLDDVRELAFRIRNP